MTEVKTDIYVTSFGPVSDVEMVRGPYGSPCSYPISQGVRKFKLNMSISIYFYNFLYIFFNFGTEKKNEGHPILTFLSIYKYSPNMINKCLRNKRFQQKNYNDSY